MKPIEIREMPAAEIGKQLRDTRERLLSLRLQKTTGQVEDTAQIRQLRRDIARMETILQEKATATAAS